MLHPNSPWTNSANAQSNKQPKCKKIEPTKQFYWFSILICWTDSAHACMHRLAQHCKMESLFLVIASARSPHTDDLHITQINVFALDNYAFRFAIVLYFIFVHIGCVRTTTSMSARSHLNVPRAHSIYHSHCSVQYHLKLHSSHLYVCVCVCNWLRVCCGTTR